jgi:DNA-binding MurR/RpiR family transcriptional regulator
MASAFASQIDPPEDYHHLKRLIASRQLTFPNQLEQIARLALDHPELIAFDSARTVASKCGVSSTSVNRFAHHLGFNSYREMKALFRGRLKELAKPVAELPFAGRDGSGENDNFSDKEPR